MSFEAEVIPLFIGGVIAVSLMELVLGLACLRDRKRVRPLLIGHVVSMAAGFVFLIRSMFANWLKVHYDIASISNSVNIGLFGVFWMVSVWFVIALVRECARKQ